jgi:transcription initiation factor TFIIIB Brf1 subunit/transcription initiation factor TFIIB
MVGVAALAIAVTKEISNENAVDRKKIDKEKKRGKQKLKDIDTSMAATDQTIADFCKELNIETPF